MAIMLMPCAMPETALAIKSKTMAVLFKLYGLGDWGYMEKLNFQKALHGNVVFPS